MCQIQIYFLADFFERFKVDNLEHGIEIVIAVLMDGV